MQYQTLTNYTNTIGNTPSLATPFSYASTIVPSFIPLVVLFPLFMIVCLGTYFSSKRLTGRGDFWASFVAAGFLTTIAATLLSLTSPPLCNLGTLITCLCVFCVGVVILFFTRE